MLKKIVSLFAFFNGVVSTPNMNGPYLYDISNPNISSGKFSTNFTDITPEAEFFDVYSPPITSRYGDVYWTMMPEIPLSKEIVSRFNNKVMAITGYEMDQVIVHPNGTEEPIPCFWSYNHHYVAHLQGANSKMIKVKNSPKYEMWDFSHGPESYKFITIDESATPNNIETSQLFSSANGGESRGSFHGYPNNKAQLIHSPKSFYIQPMQIDTRNRDPKYINDKSQYHPGLLPKNNKAPPTASYSGLSECPCTDRLKKNIKKTYKIQSKGYCKKPILNETECYNQVSKQSGKIMGNLKIINSSNEPSGCYFIKDNKNQITGYLNNINRSDTECGLTKNTNCICEDGISADINGIPFYKYCLDEPYGDLVQQKNPTCSIETYIGGLSCCHHKYVLLDKDQVQPNHTMTYQIKFRFWFTEYKNQTGLVRSFAETERSSGEYDVIKCPPGTPTKECVHIITSRFQGKDMVSPQVRGKSRGFKFVYVSGHCHFGSCLTMELSNADTGELICHVDGDMGKNRNDIRFDEKDYVKLNPCIWGDDKGLMKPRFYSWDANFTSVKRSNATDYFTGEMALWQNHVELVF